MRSFRRRVLVLVLSTVLLTEGVTVVALWSELGAGNPTPGASYRAWLLATAIALLVGGAGAWTLGMLGRRWLHALTQALGRVAAGKYDAAVPEPGDSDLAALTSTVTDVQRAVAAREGRISFEATHDALTGLPNRSRAERELDELLNESSSPHCALIVVELRNVREINASLGHSVGDEALREAARRLRQNAGPADVVARLGPNQFLVLARDCTVERAPLLAEQLVGTLRSGFHLPTVSLELHVTAGVCTAPEHGTSSRDLLRRAQIALEDAEELRGRIALYTPGRDEELRSRLALVADLRRAIEENELTLVYQPKVLIATRSVRSLEALLRWSHPQLGAISPSEFVPLAEATGGSRRLTSWVLRAALRQIAAWRHEGIEVDIAVNLSATDILDPSLGDEILGYLRERGIEPERLVLEITESAVMRDAPLAARHMQLLRMAGVRFAIDDFGTGYSSLSQISRLPVDELKIDRSFMQHAHERRDDATIVRSTIELAHSVGLKVVAEGVEHPEGWNLLRQLGCDCAQGYLISRPLPAAEVPAFLRQANAAAGSTVRQLRAIEERGRSPG
ncbi:MAG TPA: EAL domain-containing protein [Steroidobacteraceae bacterium]|nr:EAL domain-containing protein [Steroidobacteraceae bacterium]